MYIELVDKSVIEISYYSASTISFKLKLDELVSIIKKLSVSNMKVISIIKDDVLVGSFSNMKLDGFSVTVSEDDNEVSVVVNISQIPEDTIQLAKEREKAEAKQNIFLIGMNHADPEEVVRWCEELLEWKRDKYPYKKGERFKYNGKPYEIINDLVSDPYQTPDKYKALYKEVTKDNKPVYPEWTKDKNIKAQPGQRYIYAGDIWECTWTDNTRAPGGLGWKKVTE